jgi:hypothetical protein
MQLLQKQRMEFEDILAQRLREQEHVLSIQMQQALQSKDASIQQLLQQALQTQAQEHEQDKKFFAETTKANITSELDQQYGKAMNAYKETTVADLTKKTDIIQRLVERVDQLQSALDTSETIQRGSKDAHRLSAAALALTEKLESNHTAAREIETLRVAAGPNGVITTVLATIPDAIDNGVPTVPTLQSMFESVYPKSRQAALVPEGRPGLEGQLVGKFLASIKYPPHPNDPVPVDDPNNAEYVLARAREYVKSGKLEEAVSCLDQLHGQAAYTVNDWRQHALHRIAVDKALKVIKLECALLNESLV